MTIKLARDLPEKPYNTTLNRFDPKYWTIDYNALMVATIIPINERGFKMPAQWRSNADFLGVRWNSEDTFDHEYLRYATDINYRDTILAFRANPSEPHKFTVTITYYDVPYTHRLVPYVLNPETNMYEDLDPQYGSGRKFPADIITPQVDWTAIPDEEMTEFQGRKDYIYVLDFNDIRLFAMLDGPRIAPDNLAQISFDMLEWTHGLGKYATINDIQEAGEGLVRLQISGAVAGAVLSAGDKLQAIYQHYSSEVDRVIPRQDVFEIVSWTGFGGSALDVIAKGKYYGPLVSCDVLYARYLKVSSPSQLVNSAKYIVDITVSGQRKTIAKKHYPQPAHSLMMTSGFDDGYNLSPDRQVEMVHNMGYRGFWTTYIGMSHYFNARTAYMDRETGEIVAPDALLDFPVLFMGESQIAAHFIFGLRPNRGRDAFQARLAELFDVTEGNVVCINGATAQSASERMASVNPDSAVYDPSQTSGGGGLWWWDIEANTPGPAFANAIRQLNGRKPRAVIWGQGDQDASAIMFPGARVPVPSPARSKAATQAIFAHMRSLWGAGLKIFVQEQAWGWDELAAQMPDGTPIYLSVSANSWGDIVFNWLSYRTNPAGHSYSVEIMRPDDPSVVMRTISVAGTNIYGGLITADYPVEMNIPDAVETRGAALPWENLRWRVVRDDDPATYRSQLMDSNIVADNAAFVKKTVAMGVNALISGYFTDLSDPLNPGDTGAAGRKDVTAVSTFRQALASALGLRVVEVLPLLTAVPSSPLMPMPYQPGFPTDNYWWDPVANEPGPNLLLADAVVQASGRVPDYFVESGTGEAWGLMYADEADRAGIMADWRSSNIAMLAWMRSNWGNAALQVWFQGATTSWLGTTNPPKEMSGASTQLVRDMQRSMAAENIGFKVGTYVPDANVSDTYRDETGTGIGWLHYTVEGYHAAAEELGTNMGLGVDMGVLPPPWALLRVPTGLAVYKLSNHDLRAEWTTRAGVPNWLVANRTIDNATMLGGGIQATGSFTFTKAQQIAAYGFETRNMNIEVAEYDGTRGGSTTFSGEADSGLDVPVGLLAQKMLNGDIEFTWDASPGGHTDFWYENMDPSDVILSSGVNTTRKVVFTKAEQIAAYGFEASTANFKVYEYRSDKTAIGMPASWNGAPEASAPAFQAVTGFSAVQNPAEDWVFTWDAPATAGRSTRFACLNVATSAIIFTQTGTTTTATFTKAAQIAEYGFAATTVSAWVCEYAEATEGPRTYL